MLGWVWLDMGKDDGESKEMRKAHTGYEGDSKIRFFRECVKSKLSKKPTEKSVSLILCK